MTDPEKAPLLAGDRLSDCTEIRAVHSISHKKDVGTVPLSTSRRTIYIVVALFLIKTSIFAGFASQRYWSLDNASSPKDVCLQPTPQGQPSKWLDLYNQSGFARESAERLAGAVKIPTQSFDDMGHLDVVPAITSLDRWTYPPFEGVIEEEWIYGRGTSDCKNNVIGILTALEYMLSNGWKPARTIVAAFGMDEEVGGERGATSINDFLEKRYGHHGIAMIVDEGGMGIETLYGTQFALPGMAEKGYGNFMIQVDMAGGHSSIPSKHTSIGILSKIISEIEDQDLFEPDMRQTSPMWGYMQCVATHGKQGVPHWITDAVRAKRPDLAKVGVEFANISPANRYLIQTSKAATVITGGNKVNALPESALVTINSRIDLYSDVAEVSEAYLTIIRKIANTYSLSIQGENLNHDEYSIGNISLAVNQPGPPSPITPTDSSAFEVFAKAVQAAFGNDVITAPSSMTGNTDTRHYVDLTQHIYRWSPSRIGTRLFAHTVDEKIKIQTHVDAIRFYTELMVQADAVGSEL
ncbi:hypothetical protein QFC22_005526 [Naganishia vaughanmartiniae]|uniref:Uncharacterized protein n=1 Tax=Naganishia vaughanmartiniae TaxID=1424756 RepID=A0ACC2WTL5_9TREE|nr:hypothetical protein QFC22_005526 [Naganishia vaughanmartiniae]